MGNEMSILKEKNQIRDLKVLIAEDDEISSLFLSIVMEPYCKELFIVGTGTEAVEACRNNPDINLIMMDVRLPEMNGYEATRQIRQFNEEVVIIAQSANEIGDVKELARVMSLGVSEFISKPIEIPLLNGLILKHFKH